MPSHHVGLEGALFFFFFKMAVQSGVAASQAPVVTPVANVSRGNEGGNITTDLSVNPCRYVKSLNLHITR